MFHLNTLHHPLHRKNTLEILLLPHSKIQATDHPAIKWKPLTFQDQELEHRELTDKQPLLHMGKLEPSATEILMELLLPSLAESQPMDQELQELFQEPFQELQDLLESPLQIHMEPLEPLELPHMELPELLEQLLPPHMELPELLEQLHTEPLELHHMELQELQEQQLTTDQMDQGYQALDFQVQGLHHH